MQITVITPKKGITYQAEVSSISRNDETFSEVLNEATNNIAIPDELKAPDAYVPIFKAAAEKYNVDYRLLVAMAKQESNFNAKATSGSGAKGIMQLMPKTAAGLGVTNAYDATQNIMAGAKYISNKLNEFNGDVKLALAAYNAGSGSVRKYGGVPPYGETKNYISKVMGYMEHVRPLNQNASTGSVDAGTSTSVAATTTKSNTDNQTNNQTDNQSANSNNNTITATITATTKKTSSQSNVNDPVQLDRLLSEFSAHESYDEFLSLLTEDLESHGIVENFDADDTENLLSILSADNVDYANSDAEAAYKNLLGSVNRVILSMIDDRQQ